MWKIADFGLTTKGMSKRAATTNESKGSAGYRAPELLKELGIIHKKSDLFAMGCILVELASGRKIFPTDLRLYHYTLTRSKPSLPSAPSEFDSRSRSYYHRLVDTMLDIDFWMRPKASEVLELVDSLSEDSTPVYVIHGNSALSVTRSISLPAESDKWEKVSWREYW
jgi:serine/threonine protein kinase